MTDEISFTPREREVIAGLLAGLRLKEIAFEMGISAGQVSVVIGAAKSRIGVETRDQLIAYCVRNPACMDNYAKQKASGVI